MKNNLRFDTKLNLWVARNNNGKTKNFSLYVDARNYLLSNKKGT